MHSKDADGMSNIVDPDQNAPLEQSDLGLHCCLGLSLTCYSTLNWFLTKLLFLNVMMSNKHILLVQIISCISQNHPLETCKHNTVELWWLEH